MKKQGHRCARVYADGKRCWRKDRTKLETVPLDEQYDVYGAAWVKVYLCPKHRGEVKGEQTD